MPHTPGPWTTRKSLAVPHGPPPNNGGWFVFPDEHEGMICDVSRNSYEQANAALIAAAPELLEVAKRVEVFLTSLHESSPWSSTEEPVSVLGIRDAARAAISKAKGDSHV